MLPLYSLQNLQQFLQVLDLYVASRVSHPVAPLGLALALGACLDEQFTAKLARSAGLTSLVEIADALPYTSCNLCSQASRLVGGLLVAVLEIGRHAEYVIQSTCRVCVDGVGALCALGVAGDELWLATADDCDGSIGRKRGWRHVVREVGQEVLTHLQVVLVRGEIWEDLRKSAYAAKEVSDEDNHMCAGLVE